jgi:SAM-dependent methyltransferase
VTLSEHAAEQGRAWGTDPEGWALYGEPHNEPLFVAVLDAAGVGRGMRVLDVGCGTGGALVLARARGAFVTGLDVSEPLLAVAHQRLEGSELVLGEADSLPFDDGSFDAVVGINAFQFAADPHTALAEAARVLAPGGRVVASLFAEPDRSESTAIHRALSTLTPSTDAAPKHAPYLLSEPGNLASAFTSAGLSTLETGEVSTVWSYPSTAALVRGILSSAGGARVLDVVDRETAATAITTAAAEFVRPDGSVAMRNTFRWVSGRAASASR